jgi:hypothetical protein
MRYLSVALLGSLIFCGCASSPGEVTEKVLVDFGIRDKPDDYVTGSDMVYDKLDAVGASEMKRLNAVGRHGEVKYEQREGDLTGKWYKEVKVYENYYPNDANIINRSSRGERGYVGYIDYSFRQYQSARTSTKVEAENATADISTNTTGREKYRYNFSVGGSWTGEKGELVK